MSTYFVGDTGWAAGIDGTIIKTTNGGNNWTSQNSGVSVRLSSISFLDLNTGYAVGGDFSPDSSLILKTTNGGETWIQLSNPLYYGQILTAVHFINNDIGYAIGISGAIIKTTNGGYTWIEQYSGTAHWLYSVHFLDANNGLIAGGNVDEGIILRTYNGGESWVQESFSNVQWLYSIFFVKENIAWAAGHNGKILKGTGNIVSVEWTEFKVAPDRYKLSQNYPNPFNPFTKISFSIPDQSYVEIKVFDLIGEEVCELVNDNRSPGNYEIEFDGSNLPSGIYICRLKANQFVDSIKLLLLK